MSLGQHRAYRNSGNRWLGDIPAHWKTERMKRLFKERQDRSTAGAEDLLSVSAYTGVSRRADVMAQGDHLSRAEALDGYKICEPGDLVINIMLAWSRGLGVTNVSGIVSPAYAVFTPSDALHPRYVHYLLRSDEYIGYFKCFSAGVIDSRLRLYPDAFGSLECILPPTHEQHAIAAFLDRETAKIDALIEEQQRLIALLAEKRQRVISHAVTKGLNPDVPMKDTGIEWLGDVPAHWRLARVARYFRAAKGKEGQLLTKEYCAAHAGEFPVYSGQTADGGVMGTLDRYEFDTGEKGVLFSTTVGAKAMSVAHLRGRFSLSQNCMVIQPTSEEVFVRFFYYHFQPLFRYHRSSIPEHMQASFRMEDLYGFVFALAPVHEQEQIARFLDAELQSFEALTAEVRAAVALLHERRSALISAAVTGKIDVRGLVEDQAEAA